MKTKKCTACKQSKTLDCFNKNKAQKDGLANQCLVCRKKDYEKNKDKIHEQKKDYYFRNKETIAKKYKKYRGDRPKNDPVFRMKYLVRNLIRTTFKRMGVDKKSKTYEILGCSEEHFRIYILKTFVDRYHREPTPNDKLHIDHIIPMATAKTEEDVIRSCHYTNLQWLLAKDNLSKRDRLDWK